MTENNKTPADADGSSSGASPSSDLKLNVTIDKNQLKKFGIIAAAAIGVVLVFVAISSFAGKQVLVNAYNECEPLLTGSGISVDDDGSSMFIDGQGEDEFSGASIIDIYCILGALDTPDSVNSRMSSTTSLMGIQEGQWNGISAQWSYHPNNGLDISLTLDQ